MNWRRLVLCALVLAPVSCLKGMGQNTVREAGDIIQEAIDKLVGESQSWQDTLTDLERDLAENAHTLLAVDARALLQTGIASAGATVMCSEDYLESRIEVALQELLHKALGQPYEPILQPHICQAIPATADLSVPAPERLAEGVVFWGFYLNGTGEGATTAEMVTEATGARIPLAPYLNFPSGYQMTLDIADASFPVPTTTSKVVLSWQGQELHTVSVKEPGPEPLPEVDYNDCRTVGPFSEEQGVGACAQGYAVRKVKCTGSNCDNLTLTCCAYTPSPGNATATTWWSSSFSEEGSHGHEDRTGFVNAIECSGRYCDNKRMQFLQSSFLTNSGICDTQGPFSEEGSNDRDCGEGWFLSGMSCSGGYCDNITLTCCQAREAQ
jgi:hypothetical protein